MLEESAASLAHFSWLMFYAGTTLLCIAPLIQSSLPRNDTIVDAGVHLESDGTRM